MAAPAVVLVPSSPHPLTKDSPVSSHSSHSRAPSSSDALESEERNSSETTIFTIYSMYSERRATWRGSAPPSQRQSRDKLDHLRDSKDERSVESDSFYLRPGMSTGTPSGTNSPSNRTSSGSAYRNSFESAGNIRASHSVPNAVAASRMSKHTSQESSELPYLHSSVDSTSSMKYNSAPFLPVPATSAQTQTGNLSSRPRHAVSSWGKYVDRTLSEDSQPDLSLHRFSQLQHSPPSTDVSDNERAGPSHARPPRPPRTSPPIDHRKSGSGDTTAGGDASVTHEGYYTAPQTIDSHMHSRMQSPLPEVVVAYGERAPTPPPPPPPPKTRTSKSSSSKVLPARPKTAPSLPSLPVSPPFRRKSSAASLPKPNTSSSPRPSTVPSESSRSSGPSEGEDPESYFVRNVYARLDVTGVRGDGYEEGIERTRAKLGHDRLSVQLAAANGGSGKEEAKEIEMLQKLDRYGFYVVPSHDRLVQLPASSLQKVLSPLPSISSTPTPTTPPILAALPTPTPSPKEAERILKWSRMLEVSARDSGGNASAWRVKASKSRKLRERVFKGVPDRWRAAAWGVLVDKCTAGKKKADNEVLKHDYIAALDCASSYDIQIDLDVPRTINGHVLFKTRYGQGQRSLFHVLHSFSLRCPECGYCQGMGPLAATLLCYYEPAQAYSILVALHDCEAYSMHNIFRPGFPGLLEAIYIQERLIEKMLPGVYASFKKNMISTTSYATKWYITLFANSVPFQTQLRLWDVFMLEGRDVFIITAVAIVWVFREHLTSRQANFETVLSLLSSFFVPESEDALMKWIQHALDDKKLRADMVRWRGEWRALVEKGEHTGALL